MKEENLDNVIDEVYNIKDQISDGAYLILMNLLKKEHQSKGRICLCDNLHRWDNAACVFIMLLMAILLLAKIGGLIGD
jgi:hypothetical protein